MLFHFLGQQVFCEYCIENIKEHLTKYQVKMGWKQSILSKKQFLFKPFHTYRTAPRPGQLGSSMYMSEGECRWVSSLKSCLRHIVELITGTSSDSFSTRASTSSCWVPRTGQEGEGHRHHRTVSLWCFGPCCQYFTYTKTKQQNVVFVCLCSCYLQQSGGDWSEHMYPRLQAPPHLPHWWEQAGPAVHRAALRKKCKMNASTVWSDKISVESTYNKAVCFI